MPQLNGIHDELRANWMYDILSTYSAEQMVIIDESSKDGRTLIRKYGRAASGNETNTDHTACPNITIFAFS